MSRSCRSSVVSTTRMLSLAPSSSLRVSAPTSSTLSKVRHRTPTLPRCQRSVSGRGRPAGVWHTAICGFASFHVPGGRLTSQLRRHVQFHRTSHAGRMGGQGRVPLRRPRHPVSRICMLHTTLSDRMQRNHLGLLHHARELSPKLGRGPRNVRRSCPVEKVEDLQDVCREKLGAQTDGRDCLGAGKGS